MKSFTQFLTESVTPDEIQLYGHGECYTFAIALHQLTGYPLAGVYLDEDDNLDAGKGDLVHACVKPPNKNFWIDIHGAVTKTDLENFYDASLVIRSGQELTEREISHIWVGAFSQQDIDEAKPVARRLLKELSQSHILPGFHPIKASNTY